LVTLNATSESLAYVAAIGCREQIALGHVVDSTPPGFPRVGCPQYRGRVPERVRKGRG
jgi:hypothetical protein